MLDELRRLKPVTASGWRRHKHFQYLTADTGNEHLDRRITSVITLMRVSDTKGELETQLLEGIREAPMAVQERPPLVIDAEF